MTKTPADLQRFMLSQEQVDYQDAATEKTCGTCDRYAGDNACYLVNGTVSPRGTCNRFLQERTVICPVCEFVFPDYRTRIFMSDEDLRKLPGGIVTLHSHGSWTTTLTCPDGHTWMIKNAS